MTLKLRASSVLLLLSTIVPSAAWASHNPAFADRVRRNFANWDLNHDGKISAGELARLVQDRSIVGRDAAALATLKHFSVPSSLEVAIEITRPLLDEYVEKFRRDDPNRTAFTTFYESYCRKIANAHRELVSSRLPHREAIHQGADGDCYFLAAIGSMLARNPREVLEDISQEPDGSYTVKFPNQAPVRICPPTDAEIALYDNSLNDGIWLFILEKAYGALRISQNRKFQKTIEPFDATGGRGSARDSIKVLTGRGTWQWAFEHGAFGEERNSRMQSLRDRLCSALEARQLLTVRTDLDPGALPFKVPHMHVWSVLDFDPRHDLVTLWNPWGDELKPGGPDNFGEGYSTHQGVMKVSIEELYTFWWGLIGEQSDGASPRERPDQKSFSQAMGKAQSLPVPPGSP
jgi:hypothetical protein